MICSRRTLLRLGTVGLACSWTSGAAAAEPIWTGPPDVDEFALLGDEIVTVGEYLRVLDAATGRERRSARIPGPAPAEGSATVTAIASAVVFCRYVWHEDVHVLCADPQSLAFRWQRRIKITERERDNLPYVFPLVRPDGIFVLVSHKHSENLFRLNPWNGETVWSRYVERFAVRAPVAWHSGRLLVRSRVTRGAQAAGDFHAIDPANGSTLWRVRLEGADDADRDSMLISDNRAYIASPVYPGESSRLHIVDLTAGVLVKSLTIDRLGEPFAEQDGIVYFGGNTPTGWDLTRERVIWRTDLTQRNGRLLYISPHAVLDPARRRIYLGEYDNSFFVLSSTDGAILGSVDVRRGHTNPTRIMGMYGASRLRLARDLLIVGAGDRRLFAYPTAAL
jgi:outer membrane protein assembly factor BamB